MRQCRTLRRSPIAPGSRESYGERTSIWRIYCRMNGRRYSEFSVSIAGCGMDTWDMSTLLLI
jgi:hypothetical protein